jgi:hypothetical protein
MEAVIEQHPCSCEFCHPNHYLGLEGDVAEAPRPDVQNDQKDESSGLRILDAAARQYMWLLTGTLY